MEESVIRGVCVCVGERERDVCVHATCMLHACSVGLLQTLQNVAEQLYVNFAILCEQQNSAVRARTRARAQKGLKEHKERKELF